MPLGSVNVSIVLFFAALMCIIANSLNGTLSIRKLVSVSTVGNIPDALKSLNNKARYFFFPLLFL